MDKHGHLTPVAPAGACCPNIGKKLKADAWAGLEAFQQWIAEDLDAYQGEHHECLKDWLRFGLSVKEVGSY